MLLYSFIRENYTFIFLVIVFIILLVSNTQLERNVRSVFFAILFLEIIECVFSVIPNVLGNTYADFVINSLLSHINYAIRPILLYHDAGVKSPSVAP